MLRFFYAILTYLLLPVYALYWFSRGIVNRSYWDRFGQRFGLGLPQLPSPGIWIHAVSVGEVQAAVPLVRALRLRFPERPLLITTVTPTGAARAKSLFGDSVYHSYIPFETPDAVTRFFDAAKPQVALIMETEIWPNLFHECGARKIPLVLVSARISSKSVKRYRKLLPLFRETLSHGIVIAAQSEVDADRFRSLGARPDRTRVTGNIKFDIEIPEDLIHRGEELKRRLFAARPVWVAASTHHREEEQILAAHRRVLEQVPEALLVLVPRHPERFDSVRQLLDRQRVSYVARTEERPPGPATTVLLGDTMGEVPLFYAASDIAFVGGTLVPVGGHNLLEPAALGLPVVTGPHLFNTQAIADMFINIGALTRVADAEQLSVAVARLFQDEKCAARLGQLGLDIVAKNRGALERLLNLTEPLIPAAPGNGVRTGAH